MGMMPPAEPPCRGRGAPDRHGTDVAAGTGSHSPGRRRILAAAGTLPALAAAAPAAGATAPSAAPTGNATMPDDFVWGAATSAYQIEGTPTAAGGGESVWDVFCRRPGAIRDGSSGTVACDHVNRYRDDVALMRRLGLHAYRFSLSWPRLFPDGAGRRNAAGFDFYDRLIDALLAAGIAPWITLYHWDQPQGLHARGGWLRRESADWFADYAQAAVERWSDRVGHWMTFNEPDIFIHLGYQLGVHAPGEKRPRAEVLHVAHHVLLAHGRAVQAMRAAARRPIDIGLVLAMHPGIPATEREDDVDAARRFSFGGLTGWLAEAAYAGAWAERQRAEYGADLPASADADLPTIAQPLDFFGMNCYQGAFVRAGDDRSPQALPRPQGHPRTAFAIFDVVPEALRWGPRWVHERYRLPVVITENGMSLTDWVSLEGRIDDPQRIDFLRRYLRALREAVRDGVPVRGYFAWSLLDNFEWAEGYRERFGLIHVDWATQRRQTKASFDWYRGVIRSNGATL